MKCKMLCVLAVLGLSAITLAQNPSPLLLANIPAKDAQSVVVTSSQHCDSNSVCTTTGVDPLLASALASGGNRYDSQGKLFMLRIPPSPQPTTEVWLMKPNGSLTKFADIGVPNQSCTADSNGAASTVSSIGDFSFNLANNSLRVLTEKSIQTLINSNGWAWGCDPTGTYSVLITQGSGSPPVTNDITIALLSLTGSVL
jgi:hypothetical protein